MKLRVAQAIFTLSHGGAENLGMTILDGTRNSVDGIVCGIFGDGGPLEESLQARKLDYHSIDAGNRGKFGTWRVLYRFFKENKIDVVHVQAGYLLLFVVIPAKLAGVKIIYTEHAKHSIQTKPLVRTTIKLLAPLLDAITTVSHDLKIFFHQYLGLPLQRVEHIPNAVDIDRFDVEGNSERGGLIPGKGIVFGLVARMTEAKDHGNLLLAFKDVLEYHDNISLVLVGDGETRRDVEQMIEEYGLSNSVFMLGRRDNVPELLRGMDIFVLPSKREGAPISVLEAMSCGVPVVATDVGGVSEILSNGDNGLVVPPEDHKALASAMIWMLDHPEKRQAFAVEGVKLVTKQFSNRAMCAQYLKLYHRVVS